MPPTPLNQKILDHLKQKYPKIKFGVEHRDSDRTFVRWWIPKNVSNVSIVKHLNKFLSPLKKVAILKECQQLKDHISGVEFGFGKVEISREVKGGYARTD